MAAALADIEARPDSPETLALLNAAYAAPRAHVVGVTGPPGVGKSTLLGALIERWRAQGRTIGVIAVDPSSRRSGGALLGDRTRLRTDPDDGGLFVRSMAARDRLGGLAELTIAAMILMRAVYDLVLLETVGVGQSETDISGAADTVVLCVQPSSGDSLQFMKAGIVEIPHIVAVTKSDMGAPAERAKADVVGAFSLTASGPQDWPARIVAVSATRRAGLDVLSEALDAHWSWLRAGRLDVQRHAQAEAWLEQAVRERFGREGLRKSGPLTLVPGESPFARLTKATRLLTD